MNETTSAPDSTLRVEGAKSRSLINCWLLPAGTGILLALAFPPFNFGQLGWVALIPLLFAVEGCTPSEAFRRGYVAGIVFFALTIWWIIHVTLPGMVALVAFLALYFGAGALWFAWVMQFTAEKPRLQVNSTIRNLLAATLGTTGWITLEWVRGKLLFGGFPWNFLGVTQWRAVPLIQFASITGVYGVSALVCFVNSDLLLHDSSIHRASKTAGSATRAELGILRGNDPDRPRFLAGYEDDIFEEADFVGSGSVGTRARQHSANAQV